jgi:hypothetical protein
MNNQWQVVSADHSDEWWIVGRSIINAEGKHEWTELNRRYPSMNRAKEVADELNREAE